MVVARGRVKAIFDNDFPMFGKWDQLSEEQRCSDEVYSHFAEFFDLHVHDGRGVPPLLQYSAAVPEHPN